ncbi:MAG TPA: hypothetical protein VFT19_13005 [Solirubrobacterales bacterium]|nr:hypothetical protein [Solirubrobacterales bacterium]
MAASEAHIWSPLWKRDLLVWPAIGDCLSGKPGTTAAPSANSPKNRRALPRFASFPQAVGFLAEYRAIGPTIGSVLHSLLVALLSGGRIVSEVRAYGPEGKDHKPKDNEGKKANKYFPIRVVNRLAV